VKLGLTLPSFIEEPDRAVAVAVAAEAAGVDGVFVYDHLFRFAADGSHRPALECVALLGAVAAATRRVLVGTLVARASLRPSASLIRPRSVAVRKIVSKLVPGTITSAWEANSSL